MTPLEKDALLYARTGKREKLLECFANGVSPNLCGLLHEAAERGWLPIAELLLARGADPNQKDSRGVPPLYHARQKHHSDLIRLLEPLTFAGVSYSVDEALQCPNPVDGYSVLRSSILKDFHRGYSAAELRVLSLNCFLIFAVPNGVKDMLWQGGLWSISSGIELFDAIDERHWAELLREADALIRELASRACFNLSDEHADAVEFMSELSPHLARFDDRLFASPANIWEQLTAKTMQYVRDNRHLFTNPV